MHKRQQFSAFQSYLKDRERRIKRLVSAIEKRGVEGALDRCRLLVDLALCRAMLPERRTGATLGDMQLRSDLLNAGTATRGA
jgi:hypothetical protein